MARGTVNKVMLIGRLGADPELRYTPSGTPVANFRIATNRILKDPSGQQQERTEWHNIVAWQRLAEISGEWLKKGSLVYVEGRLQTRSWEDKNGVRRWTTEVIAERMQMLGPKAEALPEEEPEQAAPEGATGPDENLPF